MKFAITVTGFYPFPAGYTVGLLESLQDAIAQHMKAYGLRDVTVGVAVEMAPSPSAQTDPSPASTPSETPGSPTTPD